MSATRRFTTDGSSAATGALATLVGAVADATGATAGEAVAVRRTWLDTFDGALWQAGLVAMVAATAERTLLHVSAAHDGDDVITGSIPVTGVPRWPAELPRGRVRTALERVVGVRALLPVAVSQGTSVPLAVRDKRDKLVVRLTVERATSARRALPDAIRVIGVRGYDKHADKAARRLVAAGFVVEPRVALVRVLAAADRTPGPQLRLPTVTLHPDERADAAVKRVLARELAVLRGTLQGTIDDLDSEFLHDFRVASRRTRSVLSLLKGVFPPGATDRALDRFRWLGQVTGPARDLDVHLLQERHLRKALPAAIRDDLGPLHAYLVRRQAEAHAALSATLAAAPTRRLLDRWEDFVTAPAPLRPSAPRATVPLGELVRRRTRSALQRVLDLGRAIDDDSPPEALHTLRKACKKLRYLLELFHGVLEDGPVDRCLRDLKGLQGLLGDFQDQEVQADALAAFAEDMVATGEAPAATLLAMGKLVDDLRAAQQATRTGFAAAWARFDRGKVRGRFDTLLGVA